jgi:hypothetical protein
LDGGRRAWRALTEAIRSLDVHDRNMAERLPRVAWQAGRAPEAGDMPLQTTFDNEHVLAHISLLAGRTELDPLYSQLRQRSDLVAARLARQAQLRDLYTVLRGQSIAIGAANTESDAMLERCQSYSTALHGRIAAPLADLADSTDADLARLKSDIDAFDRSLTARIPLVSSDQRQALLADADLPIVLDLAHLDGHVRSHVNAASATLATRAQGLHRIRALLEVADEGRSLDAAVSTIASVLERAGAAIGGLRGDSLAPDRCAV